MGQRRVASPATATTDLLALDFLNKCGRAFPPLWGALHSTLLTIFPIAEGRHRQADLR
jgi:hypothetical protein